MTATPSRAAVQGALRVTTERLAGELARPTRQRPDWSDFEWRIARAAAAVHGASPLLRTRLLWQGPEDWQSFLASQRAHTEQRQHRIEQLLWRVDALARDEALGIVALKGAALHGLGLYKPGERPMADLDLLVARQDVTRASSLLETLGFRQTLTYWRHRSFSPADTRTHTELGEHADNYIKIELHEQLSERLPVRQVDVSDLVMPDDPRPGLNPYRSGAALMAHLLLHTAGSIVTRSVRLLQLHDIALLTERLTERDWCEILDSSGNERDPWWWALPPLMLTARYYPNVVRPDILKRLSLHCPRHLRKIMQGRTLSDVSLSYLTLEAFPGIEWAQSSRERARYVSLRILPSAEMLATRRSQALTEPGLAGNPWTHLRQGARILHWMVRRPARPATMYAVNAALSQ
ncbi:MAG TPA: nucleotidyltransferase family protein [Steroidobacteraceae bacterium]|nr:nucleotidyltransferase family protein [Steroidobacteraceae bacterium]